MLHTIGLSTQPRRAVEVRTIKVQGTWKIAQTSRFGIDEEVVIFTPEQAAALIFALECAIDELAQKAAKELAVSV